MELWSISTLIKALGITNTQKIVYMLLKSGTIRAIVVVDTNDYADASRKQIFTREISWL